MASWTPTFPILALLIAGLLAACAGAQEPSQATRPVSDPLPPKATPQPSSPPLGAVPRVTSSPPVADPEPSSPAAAGLPPGVAACRARLRTTAMSAGIDADLFDRHVATVRPDPTVLGFLDAQPEFTTPLWDYLAGLVDDERVADGREQLRVHAELLARVAQRYGVDAETVVAVWGVESNFGRTFGKRPLLVSLATLACQGRRQAFFRGELIDTLHIIQSGDVAPEALVGSWAGAFGHTQFMPSTFRRIAVDFDGDGRRDLAGNVADALASTAHFLRRAGWRSGEPWGHEVSVPEGTYLGPIGRTHREPLRYWLARGIVRADGQAFALDGNTPAALLLPVGRRGPAFLVFRNFHAMYSYNASESYALAIALLSDRLRGRAGLKTPWPTDDAGLSRMERRELQRLLLARGHAIGEADGIIGTATRRAIVAEQQRLGLVPQDGRAGLRILQALRGMQESEPGESR